MTSIRLAAAEHEAAHVLAARHFGVPVQSAWVGADGSGMTVLAGAPSTSDDLFRRAVIASAGAAYGACRGHPAECSAHDQDQVRRLREQFVALEGREMFDPHRGATALVTQLIDARALDAVATALETGRALTGAEIDVIVRAAVNTDVTSRAMAWHRADLEAAAAEYERQPALAWHRRHAVGTAPRPESG